MKFINIWCEEIFFNRKMNYTRIKEKSLRELNSVDSDNT